MSKKNTSGRKPRIERVEKPVNLAEQGGRFAPMKPVTELWFGNTDCKPVNYSWGEGYGETYETHEASRCEECGAIVVGYGGDRHCDADSESECEGYIPSQSGPMMNYYYPLDERSDIDPTEAAKALVDLPVCLVEWLGDEQDNRGQYALALTGGGMDLSWEICEAFMRLGYLPPIHFADLSEMPGYDQDERGKWIVAGCRRSLQGAKHQIGRALRNLRERFGAKSEKGAE